MAQSYIVLSEKEFNDFVLTSYEPSPYESKELEDARFETGTYYSHLCRTRSYLVYREIARRFDGSTKIIDFGFFPGTLVRQLKILLGDKVTCFGAGVSLEKKFLRFMAPYVEDSVDVELDPFYCHSDKSIRVPFESGFFDAVIATEVLEHLISPLEMISEGARILRRNGLFFITTPNVSHIGAVLKLALGRSNYERLDRSPMHLQKDPWRGHIRFYDRTELKTLFQRHGLDMVRHQYYQEKGWAHAKWPFRKRIMSALADMFAPIYREGHFAVFKKR